MKINNKIILTYIMASGIGIIALAAYDVGNLAVYYIVTAILFLLTVLFYGELKPAVSKTLFRISTSLVLGFVFLLGLKVVEWLK